MAQQWFYSSSGKKTGPIPTEELLELIASGRLTPTDVVQRQGTQKWVPIISVEGLAPKAEPKGKPNAEPISELDAQNVRPEKQTPPGVTVAAIAMLVVSGAALAISGLGLIAVLTIAEPRVILAIAIALSLIHNCATIYNILQLLRLADYKLATIGSYLGMGSWFWLLLSGMPVQIPILGIICGIAAGSWSIWLLKNPDVRAAFAKP